MKATRPERSMLYAIEGTSTKNEENDRSIVPVNGIKSVAQPTDTCTCCGARYRPCSTETSHDKPGNTGPVRPARSNGIRRGRGRRRSRRPGHRDSPEAAGGSERHRNFGRRAGEGLRAWGAHAVRRNHGPDRPQRTFSELEGTRRTAEPARHRRHLPDDQRDRRDPHAQHAPAGMLPQPRQLHRQPGCSGALDGPAGREPRRRDFSWLRGGRGALPRRWLRQGRGHRKPGHRKGWRTHRELPAGHGTACQVHHLRRRFARPPG